jgi:hypothetical protein
LRVLCELMEVTVSPKWDLIIKLFLLGRSSFLNRLHLSKVLLRRYFSPRVSPILVEVAISSLFFALSSLFLGTRTVAIGFLL